MEDLCLYGKRIKYTAIQYISDRVPVAYFFQLCIAVVLEDAPIVYSSSHDYSQKQC